MRNLSLFSAVASLPTQICMIGIASLRSDRDAVRLGVPRNSRVESVVSYVSFEEELRVVENGLGNLALGVYVLVDFILGAVLGNYVDDLDVLVLGSTV